MNEEETPFSQVPPTSRTESPSSYTYEGQLERVGLLATGLRSHPSGTRLAVRILVGILIGLLVLSFVVGIGSAVWNAVSG